MYLSPFRWPKALWLILAVALGLRLLGAWCANLIFDERAHWALAETIDLRPAHLHLVSRSLDHPLLSIYVLKLSSLLFGASNFGLRLLHVLAGTATLVPVYFLGRRTFGERAALWAAGLLAVDQFHAGWSRVFMPEVLMLLLAAAAMLQLLRALETGSTGNYALLGLLLGLACLAKEPAILLIPAFWLYLLLTPQHRSVLRRPRWYLAHAVFLAVIAPDVLWNLALATESYLYRDATLIAAPLRLSLISLSLYLGEIFRALLGADVLDKDYVAGNVYACHWPAGLLYLAAVAAALGRRRCPAVRLLLVVFLLVFAAFIVLPGGGLFDPFWWASISLIPAVVCAGWVLDWASGSGRRAKFAAFLLLGYLGLHYAAVALHAGPAMPRTTVEQLAADALKRGNADLARNHPHAARQDFIYALNVGGPNAEAYFGLALVARHRGRPDNARWWLSKCLELDPGHARAIKLMERIRQPRPH